MTAQTPPQEQQAVPAETPKQNDKEYNFAQLRKQLDEERQARLKLEESVKAAKQTPRVEEEDDDEPYVDRKKLNRELSKIKDEFDQKIDQRAEQKARLLVEEERRNSYLREKSDFQQVLSSENLQRFAEKHPEVAQAMLRMPDTFERQQLLYEQMKALNVHKKEEPKIQDTINKNMRSPYYRPTSESAPPYASTGDFSPSGQKNAYAKMKDLINNRRAL